MRLSGTVRAFAAAAVSTMAVGCGQDGTLADTGGDASLAVASDAAVTVDAAAPVDAATGDAAITDAAPSTDAAPLPPERVLFVGNSFTFVNDLPGTFASLARSAPGRGAGPAVDSVAYSGYTLAQHLADAQGTGPNPRLAALLGNADAGPVTWNHVVLQEQSEIPGFDPTDPERVASMNAVVALSGLAAATGATTVLFMTWGFPGGDPANPTLYPAYLTMQSRLETGYRDMAHAVALAGHPVRIAPAGLAFEGVYERDVAAGHVPEAQGSLFAQLFGPDAKHPSPAGTFLAACVMTATIYDVDATTLGGSVPGLDAATVAVLESIAQSVVVAERQRRPP
jgi:hypothetical protein